MSQKFINPKSKYARQHISEGRNASAENVLSAKASFDEKQYLRRNASVANADIASRLPKMKESHLPYLSSKDMGSAIQRREGSITQAETTL